MNYSDEQMQKRVEGGSYSKDSLDEKAYDKVFRALKREPYQLPPDFADKIIIRVESRSSLLFKDYFWFGLGLCSFIIATIVIMMKDNFFKLDFGSSKFITTNWSLIAFAAAFILLIHYIDKRLIRNRLST